MGGPRVFHGKTGEIEQFIRFAVVGAGNLVLDLVIFNALWSLLDHRPGAYMGIANGAAYAVATAAGYLANRFWSFRREGMLLGYLFVYGTTGALAAVGLPMVAAYAAGTLGSGVIVTNMVKVAYTLLLASLNYSGLRLLVFKSQGAPNTVRPVQPRPTRSERVPAPRALDAS